MINLINTPLEQFEIFPIFISKYITNASLTLLCIFVLIILFFRLPVMNGFFLVPNAWQLVCELLCSFILGILKEQVGKQGQLFFPLIFTLFIFILGCNLFGMIPYVFTITSHIVVTFGLSFTFFFGLVFIGLKVHSLHFFSLFLPGGSPLVLIPVLIIIEVISFLIRPLSLAIRLFANMTAGHTLLNILAGFGWKMAMVFNQGLVNLLYIGHFFPIFIVFLLMGLEIGISFLQAYVFTILICIYINDALKLH